MLLDTEAIKFLKFDAATERLYFLTETVQGVKVCYRNAASSGNDESTCYAVNDCEIISGIAVNDRTK